MKVCAIANSLSFRSGRQIDSILRRVSYDHDFQSTVEIFFFDFFVFFREKQWRSSSVPGKLNYLFQLLLLGIHIYGNKKTYAFMGHRPACKSNMAFVAIFGDEESRKSSAEATL